MQTSSTGHTSRKPASCRLKGALTGVLLASTLVLACASSPTSPTSVPTPNPTNTAGNIVGKVEGNHPSPHLAVLTAAQLAAAAPVEIDMWNGFHSHKLRLTGAQVTQIAAGTRVSVASSIDPHSNGADPHSHGVTFN